MYHFLLVIVAYLLDNGLAFEVSKCGSYTFENTLFMIITLPNDNIYEKDSRKEEFEVSFYNNFLTIDPIIGGPKFHWISTESDQVLMDRFDKWWKEFVMLHPNKEY